MGTESHACPCCHRLGVAGDYCATHLNLRSENVCDQTQQDSELLMLALQAVKDEKKKTEADDTVVLKAPQKPGAAKAGAALSKEHLLRPDDADDEDPGVRQHGLLVITTACTAAEYQSSPPE